VTIHLDSNLASSLRNGIDNVNHQCSDTPMHEEKDFYFMCRTVVGGSLVLQAAVNNEGLSWKNNYNTMMPQKLSQHHLWG